MLNIAGISLVESQQEVMFRQHHLEMQHEELGAAPGPSPCCWLAKLFALSEQKVEFLKMGILVIMRRNYHQGHISGNIKEIALGKKDKKEE